VALGPVSLTPLAFSLSALVLYLEKSAVFTL